MKRKTILFLLGLTFVASQVLATGINVYINDGGITDKDGRTLSDDDYHPYKSKLEFFHNTLPAPNSSSGKLSVDPSTQYTKIGTQNKYQLSSLDGGTLYVRAWKGTVAPTSPGDNYYGKASHGVASGTTLPYDWTCSIKTVYKADVPFAPTISSISEALQRSGDSFNRILTILLTYNELDQNTNERREITDLSLKVTYPGGSIKEMPGSMVTLTDAPAGKYTFQPIAKNWYGITEGAVQTYETSALLGPQSFILTLESMVTQKGTGINSFAMPFAPPWYAFKIDETPIEIAGNNEVKSMVDLIYVINKAAGDNIVSTMGVWNDSNQMVKGIKIKSYDNRGEIQSYELVGANALEDLVLVQSEGYQVYVKKGVTILIKNTPRQLPPQP